MAFKLIGVEGAVQTNWQHGASSIHEISIRSRAIAAPIMANPMQGTDIPLPAILTLEASEQLLKFNIGAWHFAA